MLSSYTGHPRSDRIGRQRFRLSVKRFDLLGDGKYSSATVRLAIFSGDLGCHNCLNACCAGGLSARSVDGMSVLVLAGWTGADTETGGRDRGAGSGRSGLHVPV
jgi:hypothetical protein